VASSCGSAAPGAKGTPYLRSPRPGAWPYTDSVVKSFRGSFVWVLWLVHQVRSVVAATSLGDSTESIKDWPRYFVYKFEKLESDLRELCWLARK
jgi:hypothetical protein